MSFTTLSDIEQDLDCYYGPAVDLGYIRPGTYWRRRTAGLPGVEVFLHEWPHHTLLIRADPLRPCEASPRVTGWALHRDQPGGPVEVFAMQGWVHTQEAIILAVEYLKRLERLQGSRRHT